MNRIVIIGNLTRNPESRQINDTTVTKFTVAVTRRFKPDTTDYFPVVTWRGVAENCYKHLAKGSKVAVSGEIQFRTYEDKEGKNQTIAELIADEVKFLSSNGESQRPVDVKATEEDLPF